jgi:hypothetical protein
MGKKREEADVVEFRIHSVTTAPDDIFAVYDEGDGEFSSFPVILFALGDLVLKTGPQKREEVPGVVHGMVSNLGGLVMVEGAPDMTFIGYWRKNAQELADFLEEHEVEVPPHLED